MTASAQGKDVSAYQQLITPADAGALDFMFVKATEGLTLTDPNFAGNWAVLGGAGLHRGAYHEYHPEDDPLAQAQHFVSAVKAHGLQPGDMLALVASDYPGTADASFKAACDWTAALAGPTCPVLAYTDLSVAKTLIQTSQAYDLWVAWPSGIAPDPAQWAPARWPAWRFWQWGQPGGTDHDAFNGTRADLDTWIAGYSKRTIPPVPAQTPPWQEAMMNALPLLAQGATGSDVRTVQALCTARSHPCTIDGIYGPLTAAAVRAVQTDHHLTTDGITGPQTWPVLVGT
jgi:GH25 family lysozyme M1 (1,4-beta-N-acetylmuramidase)